MDILKKFKWIYAILGAALVVLLFLIPKEPYEASGAGSAPGPTPTNTPTPITVQIIAEYTGDDVVINTEINTAKLIVTAIYKDGGEERVYDYRLSNTMIRKVGENKIGVYYHGKSAEVIIFGKEELAVTYITADYVGEDVIVSNDVKKKDIVVTAYYNWPEKEPVVLKEANFSISPSKITKPGRNQINVTYERFRATVEVFGIEKEVVDAECHYIGKEAIVGSKLTNEDFQVVVKYNDDSTEKVDKFRILNPKIMGEGENIITVTWKDYIFDVPVNGVPKNVLAEAFKDVDLQGASTALIFVVSHADYAKSVICSPIDQKDLKEAVDHVVVTTKYIGYELTYTHPEAYLEFPILTRVIRPEDYDPDKFAVYYTPNRKTIMAKCNGEYLDEERTQYAFYTYRPGTYALVEEISSKLVTSINLEKQYVTMKMDRNYSIEPIVMPLSAANRDVTYWSSDEYVCTVSENGKVTSVGPGECEIWIEAADGSGIYNILYITVKEK